MSAGAASRFAPFALGVLLVGSTAQAESAPSPSPKASIQKAVSTNTTQPSPAPKRSPVWPSELGSSPAEALWVDPSGNITNPGWGVGTKWRWASPAAPTAVTKNEKASPQPSSSPSASPSGTPIAEPIPPVVMGLEVCISLPKGLNVEGTELRTSSSLGSSDACPKGASNVLSYLSPETEPQIRIDTKDVSGKTQDLAVLVRPKPNAPMLAAHESCSEQGIALFKEGTAESSVVAGAVCAPATGNRDGVDVWIFHLKETQISLLEKGPSITRTPLYGTRLHFPSSSLTARKRLAKISIQPEGGSSTPHGIMYDPALRRGKVGGWRFGVGIGSTLLWYKEPARNLSLHQIGIVLKGDISRSIFKPWLDLGVNGYFTVLPFILSPKELSPARYWGANGRVGFKPDIAIGPVSPGVSIGYYIYGMLAQTYGLTMAAGPQIFFTLSNAPHIKRGFGVYFKFAAMADVAFSINPANNEIAFGGNIQITSIGPASLGFTLDLAASQFKSQKIANDLNSKSVSTGLQLRW